MSKSKSKPAPQKKQTPREGDPPSSRPYIPGYGIPTTNKGMLPWSHVCERMEHAHIYWIGTTDPEGRPHATPVDGIWLENRLYFGGSPKTRRARNLASNPAVVVHLESGSDVVILQGQAHPLQAPDRALTTRLAEASAAKYGYRPSPDQFGEGGVYEVRPVVVLAWKQFPKDATRWRFGDKD